MLSKYDEFLCHQTTNYLNEVNTSERNWTEKVWGAASNHDGSIMLDWGFGKYINRNVMDAFGIVVINGKQYNVRASRELQPDVDEITVGPLSYEILEPLYKIRVVLDENDQGISFDIVFDGTFPISEEPHSFQKKKGVVVSDARRFYQYGTVSGTVTVEGKTYVVKSEEWSAARDRSWGIRPIVGLPPKGSGWCMAEGLDDQGMEPPPSNLLSVVIEFAGAQFKDYALHYWQVKTEDGHVLQTMGSHISYRYGHPNCGDPRKEVSISSVDHSTEFDPDTGRPTSARATIEASDGRKMTMDFKLQSFCFAGAGGYFGYKNWNHGKWMGANVVEGEVLDLTDADDMAGLLNRYDDYACEVTCDGEIGHGLYNITTAAKIEIPQ
ncbi:hypothetical protein [Halioxenophilus sp. WMMB6]|uniref:hypothetical protein n=1 Tax=Halioxenophilus sp. WMMB6 TaxID=3073815 RepID=UPI00295E9CE7|nr:hypothetical protein [Halioxenophilus sp. WMMB6]